MNNSELFEEIQDSYLIEEINGEFLLQGKLIIWTYNLVESSEEIEYEDDEENMTCFDFECSEEILLNKCREDFDKLIIFLEDIGETYNWQTSDPEIIDDLISFNIY